MRTLSHTLCCGLLAILSTQVHALETPDERVERILHSAQLEQGAQELQAHCTAHPEDAQARLGLGVVQFFASVERVSQSLYRQGVRANLASGPGIGSLFPALDNPQPQPASYDELRRTMARFMDDVSQVEQTLAPLETHPQANTFKLQLRPWKIRFDINQDGQPDPQESLAGMFETLSGTAVSPALSQDTYLMLDLADAYWLRAYCHVLRGTGRMVLSYDQRELFDRTGHLIFHKIATPYQKYRGPDPKPPKVGEYTEPNIIDLISLIHLMRFEVQDRELLKAARQDLLTALSLSERCWVQVLQEDDNDHEWLPAPAQESQPFGLRLTQGQIDAWRENLKEARAILEGEKLFPYWRGQFIVRESPSAWGKLGVNVRRLFEEGATFDLVTWCQGSGVDPYLEDDKPVTDLYAWRSRNSVFGRQWFPYAIWMN